MRSLLAAAAAIAFAVATPSVAQVDAFAGLTDQQQRDLMCFVTVAAEAPLQDDSGRLMVVTYYVGRLHGSDSRVDWASRVRGMIGPIAERLSAQQRREVAAECSENARNVVTSMAS